MTREEEKQLLLKDLCSRLPYGVKVGLGVETNADCSYTLLGINPTACGCAEIYASRNGITGTTRLSVVKPFLRPMSSMTEEEKKEYERLFENVHWVTSGLEDIGILSIDFMECYDNDGDIRNIYDVIPTKVIDWLNEHHFDYRGLIYEGLALEAKEGMYK